MTGNQLKIELKKIGITQELAAERLGVTRRTLQNWFALDVLDANISQNVKLNLQIDASTDYEKSDDSVPTINYERKGVPYYDVDFIGGFDLVLNDQTVNPEYYVNFKQYNGADYWVNVNGHSMEPEVAHGDIIAIKELNNWPIHILYGEMYAIVTTQNRTVKYVRKSTKGEDWLRLVPVNVSEYDEQDIPKSVIMKVFKVLGCTKRIQ